MASIPFRLLGINGKTLKIVKRFHCPFCKSEFSLLYSRAFACQGCREAVFNCPKVRCPTCDAEFLIRDSPLVKTRMGERLISEYMSKIYENYYKQFGWKIGQ